MRDWRSDELDYDPHIWAFVLEHLERLHPGRFRTIGDIADTTDAEFLAMPNIGPKKLANLREAVEAAMASKISSRQAFEFEFSLVVDGTTHRLQ